MADSIKSVDVPSVHGLVALNPDGSAIGTPVGGATSDNQTNGSQKTQIVDAGGDAATVTGGKLDVNAAVTLSGDSIPAAGATSAVSVQIVDGLGNQISSFGGGTQYPVGNAAGATDTGTLGLLVRDDVLTTLSDPDGDYTQGRTNSKGALWTAVDGSVVVQDGGGSLTVDNNGTFATQAAQSGTWNVTNVSGTVSLPTGAATEAKQDTGNTSLATLASTVDTGRVQVDVFSAPTTNVAQSGSWTVVADAGANLNTSTLALESGGNLAAIKAKTDNIPAQGQALAAGSLPVVLPAAQISTLTPLSTVAATQSGTWTVQPGNTANTTAWKVDGSAVTQPVSYATTGSGTATGALRVELPTNGTGVIATVGAVTAITNALPAGTNAIGKLAANSGVDIGDVDVTSLTGGTIAHDSPDSGNPIKVGGRARSSEITAIASDDRSDFITDLVGKQIVLPYANPENFVSGAITSAMTGTTSTSLVAAPAAGLRNYITTIIVSNAHASVGTDVVIQDGNAGTTLMTIPAAAVYGGAVINLPVPLRQPTTATAIYCANVTTGASTKVSAVGYKGV